MLQTEQDLQAKSGGLHYAFVICLGGFLLSGIVLAAQRLPSIALDSVRQTLGVGYAEVGLITSVFMIFYAGLSLVWGMLGDKIGTRWAMTLACALSSIGTILFGLFGGTSLAAAIVTWSICGIGCAGLLMAILPKIDLSLVCAEQAWLRHVAVHAWRELCSAHPRRCCTARH